MTIEQKEGVLDAKGILALSLDTQTDAGAPYEYKLEGVVTDVTRQEIATAKIGGVGRRHDYRC